MATSRLATEPQITALAIVCRLAAIYPETVIVFMATQALFEAAIRPGATAQPTPKQSRSAHIAS